MTEEEIREFCRGKIAHYKVPRYVKFVDEFPMTVTGKVQKYKLREHGHRDARAEGRGRGRDRLSRSGLDDPRQDRLSPSAPVLTAPNLLSRPDVVDLGGYRAPRVT